MSGAEIVAAAEALRVAAVARHARLSETVLVGLGWATVELDRAEHQLGAELGGTWIEGPPDELLGATSRLRTQTLDGVALVILEPATEGRLAASLVKFGEGVAAIYLARTAGEASGVDRRELGLIDSTPLGPARLVLGGPSWGPSVIVLTSARHQRSR